MQLNGLNLNFNSLAAYQEMKQEKENVSFADALTTVRAARTINVPMLTEDTLRGGGFNTGVGAFVSYTIKWANGSTENNPVMTAFGIDENGDAYEKTIYIKSIDPSNATKLEMLALEAYLNIGSIGTSFPPKNYLQGYAGKIGLEDRFDFLIAFDNAISVQTAGGHCQRAKEYRHFKQIYYDFFMSSNYKNKNEIVFKSKIKKILLRA